MNDGLLKSLLLAGVSALGACHETPVMPTRIDARGDIAPLCQVGCIEIDPYPNSPGVFLGICEKHLAYAFAPELAYSRDDNLGREPHWVSRPLGNRVRIVYLLSYYVDLGPDIDVCETNFPWLIGELDKCHGHAGDSELIVLDVYYSTSTQHWLLDQAVYSQHEEFRAYTRGTRAFPYALYYPEKLGGYPRSYVARCKHANYASEGECDSGAIVSSDDCVADSFARVEAGLDLNLGSRGFHDPWQDCMASSNPFFSDNGVTECYWTIRRFSGWQGFSPDADAYEPKLGYFGF